MQRQIHMGLFILMTLWYADAHNSRVQHSSAQIISKIIASGLFLCFGMPLFAYRRGWEYARPIAVVVVTILLGIGIPDSNPDNISQQITWAVLLPPVVALLLTEPDTGCSAAAWPSGDCDRPRRWEQCVYQPDRVDPPYRDNYGHGAQPNGHRRCPAY